MRKRATENLSLEEKLAKLVDDTNYLTEDQFENVQEIMDTIVKENIEANFT